VKRWLLDTSALLALRDDEAGADRVAALLGQAQAGRATCFGCFMSLMEVYYRVWKDEGAANGRLAYEQCRSLPIEWLHESPELLEAAAAIKATNSLSLADAWVGAAAQLAGATLVHKDPEFAALKLPQEVLPLK
jgi:ribonuclease VapC